jgi:hypothetical protein
LVILKYSFKLGCEYEEPGVLSQHKAYNLKRGMRREPDHSDGLCSLCKAAPVIGHHEMCEWCMDLLPILGCCDTESITAEVIRLYGLEETD